MSCYKACNNKHFNCPPMDDGRHFTDCDLIITLTI